MEHEAGLKLHRSRRGTFLTMLLALLYVLLSNAGQALASQEEVRLAEVRKVAMEERLQVRGDIYPEQDTTLHRRDVFVIDANNSPNRGNLSASQSNIWRYPRTLLTEAPADNTPGLPSNVSDIIERQAANDHHELKRRNADSADEEELDKRQTSQRVAFISINTCSQPLWTSTTPQIVAPPQLSLYIGVAGNTNPGPGSSGQQEVYELTEGFTSAQLQADSDIFMAVAAPSQAAGFQGRWTYDLAVSINNYYHAVNTSVQFLYLVDTDTTSALLVTDNLTQANSSDNVYQQWLSLPTPLPFTVFANDELDARRMGLEYSFCGLEAVRQIGGSQTQNSSSSNKPFVKTDMITRGLGNKPKQQFMVGNLSSATSYDVTLALVGNGAKSGKGVVGGGGIVWQSTSWTTKQDGNCQLLYDLPFCSEVAYAVPSNPNNFNTSGLANLYDTYASQLYQNFSFSLQQINCNTSNDQKYSLARNCDDCARAYKQWLCAVTIPRCEDFSNNASFLQPRNVGQQFFQNQSMLSDAILNQAYQPMPGAPTLPGSPIDQTWITANATSQSRNPAIIDSKIAPGPYKEVLPCEDLCYSLIQSCPAALQFSCPLPNRGLEVDYGKRPSSNTVIQCSFLGAVYYMDDSSRSMPSILLTILVGAAVAIFSLL